MNQLGESETKLEGGLVRLTAWVEERNIAFLICSVGMAVMLLWAGSFKMTRPRC
ncbi:hypothetical protein SAMN05444167_2282 [Terriglobus roseus]|uniref:Uncharacterized protein n=1 Tax=Terriglobus roseus TaxID=392734 RepID=A0A1G7KS20_9BACT|nr:hypothetical protein SAMN05444167_2282 [Terriglobus roseus]